MTGRHGSWLPIAVGLFLVCTAATAAAAPQTSVWHSIHVARLRNSYGDDASREPLLISVTERTSLFLTPEQMKDEIFDFDDNANPLWFFTLRHRELDSLEWCGCGGRWRPEWSMPYPVVNEEDEEEDESFFSLRHSLAHHVVCSFSSVSFCATTSARGNASSADSANEVTDLPNRANQKFQWAANFISTLTSSPLSWTAETPLHIHPTGIVSHQLHGRPHEWCSYHVVYHDVLCTQHVSPLLSGGRHDSHMQEGLPDGLYRSTVPPLKDVFSTPFHQFHMRAAQSIGPDGRFEVRVQTRLSFVVWSEEEVETVANLWSAELPAFAARAAASPSQYTLNVFVGRAGIPQILIDAVPPELLVRPTAVSKAPVADSPCSEPDSQLEVSYNVRSVGKDHGYVTVSLVSALAAMDEASPEGVNDRRCVGRTTRLPVLRSGDRVHTLLIFPLHLLRPKLFNMESLFGTTTVSWARVAGNSNTLAVQLVTTLTPSHIRAYEKAYEQWRQGGRPADLEAEGILLARMQFTHGWTHLGDMPRDVNSFRIVPQPIVFIERSVSQGGGNLDCDQQCSLQHPMFSGAGRSIDHGDALACIVGLEASSNLEEEARGGGQCVCRFSLRSTAISGTLIPAPDPAMVFNVLVLGLMIASLAVSWFMRSLRKLFCRLEDMVVSDGSLTTGETATEKTS